MKLRSLPYFALVCFMLLATSCSQNSKPVFKQYQTLFQIGDQQEWAAKNWNDKDWKKRPALVPGRSSILVQNENRYFKGP